jgi:transcription elongation factor GreB
LVYEAGSVPNPRHISARGAARFADELRRLATVDRPKVVSEVAEAAAQGDRSENAEYIYGKKRLREIDRRIRFVTHLLDEAIVVRPSEQTGRVVYFGALVKISESDEDGNERERTFQLVGSDEAEPDQGRISIQSPIGKALLKKTVGDVVTVKRPAGELELEILDVTFPQD